MVLKVVKLQTINGIKNAIAFAYLESVITVCQSFL